MALKQDWEKRAGSPRNRKRDRNYMQWQGLYAGENKGGSVSERSALGYAPLQIDEFNPGDDDRLSINHYRRVVAYQEALFAKPPAIMPFSAGDKEFDHKVQAAIEAIYLASKLDAQQPRQAHWLSLRGDAVFVVDWDDRGSEANVFWRSFEPGWCYPTFDDLDPGGGLKDLLVSYELDKGTIKAVYGIDIGEKGSERVFIKYDSNRVTLEIGEQRVDKFSRTHELGFCPGRWIFGGGDTEMGQSDVRDIRQLSELHSDSLAVAIDAIKKQADPAYYGTGVKSNVVPKAGEVIAFPDPNAKVAAFPIETDPQVILGAMESLELFINELTGVSPISATGQARGSIVSGSAVRSQVEAMEVRSEMRRGQLEGWYGDLMTMSLKVLKHVFKDKPLPTPLGEFKGSELKRDVRCFASYGSLFGLEPTQRVRVAMEGLGRIWDDKFAIRVMDLPGVNPDAMVGDLREYQKRQAENVAEAQKAAQEIQGGGDQPGQKGIPPMIPGGKRPPPTLQQMMPAGSQNGSAPR